MTEPKILGNPEEQKGIEKLLKQAGQDKVIKEVLGKREPPPKKITWIEAEPKRLEDYRETEPILSFYNRVTPNEDFPAGGYLVGYYAGLESDCILFSPRVHEGEVILPEDNTGYPRPLFKFTKRLTAVSTSVAYDEEGVVKMLSEDFKRGDILELDIKSGVRVIGFLGDIRNSSVELWPYKKEERFYYTPARIGAPFVLFDDITAATIMQPEKK